MAERMDLETVNAFLNESPFIAFLGLDVMEMDVGAATITMRMPLREEMERGGSLKGQFHGGPVAALIDTAADFAVSISVGGPVPTINFRVDYLRPSTGEALVAKAVARRIGRNVAVVDVDVTDSEGRLTAIGRGTFSSTIG